METRVPQGAFPLAIVTVLLALAPGFHASQRNQGAQPETAAATVTPAPPARWWRDEKVVLKLGLDKDQADRLDAIFDAFLPGQQARWTALQEQERKLSGLIERSAPESGVISQIDIVETRRFELNRSRTLMLFRLRQVLSTDQRRQLDSLNQPQQTRDPASRSNRQ